MGPQVLPTPAHIVDELSPMGSPALTEGGCSTPARNSPSPQTPSKLSTVHSASSVQTVPADGAKSQAATAGPAPKRKRLTAEEKEQRDKEQAEKKQEREEKLRLKAEEKAQQEKEKAERAAERAAEKEEKRKKKEQEEKLRAQQRDEKKRQKDEEDRKKREAEEKKARSQPSLTSFFGAPRVPKKTEPTTTSALAPTPAELPTAPELQTTQIEYAKMFKPFYLKENARMAQAPFTMDDETREAKSKILDEYMCGQRKYEHETVFDSVKSFDLVQKPGRRGRLHPPVRQIMETTYKEMEAAGTSGGHEADKLMQETRRKLAKIPVKVIAFSRDVRPPYYGTATAKPHLAGGEKLRALARRPTSRTLELDYDYDSEAEWQEEEGEDVDIDDEEEELDDEDDLDGFLDDSEDVGLARRIFANTMEPESTGVCFEGGAESSMTQTLYDHRMEYIHRKSRSRTKRLYQVLTLSQNLWAVKALLTRGRHRIGSQSRRKRWSNPLRRSRKRLRCCHRLHLRMRSQLSRKPVHRHQARPRSSRTTFWMISRRPSSITNSCPKSALSIMSTSNSGRRPRGQRSRTQSN